MRWEGHPARTGEMGNAYSILFGKGERNRPFGRPRLRWENNIRMDLRKQNGKVWTGCM